MFAGWHSNSLWPNRLIITAQLHLSWPWQGISTPQWDLPVSVLRSCLSRSVELAPSQVSLSVAKYKSRYYLFALLYCSTNDPSSLTLTGICVKKVQQFSYLVYLNYKYSVVFKNVLNIYKLNKYILMPNCSDIKFKKLTWKYKEEVNTTNCHVKAC